MLNITPNPARAAIITAYRMDETLCLEQLIAQAELSPAALSRITATATKLVMETRAQGKQHEGLDVFLHQYDLSSEEGIALMCLAEALLRIPDAETIDRLISDKLANADWEAHLGHSDSFFVNAATWSLMLTGKIYSPTTTNQKKLGTVLKQLIHRSSGLVIRPLIMQGMKILGQQFVMGRTIQEALKRAEKLEAAGYCYSYDMLGEAARTATDALHYYQAYTDAIVAIGASAKHHQTITKNPSVSIKLSALHPRYEYAKHERVLTELTPRLLQLAKLAKENNIGLTIDAEEADRLELSLDLIENLLTDPTLADWNGFGLALQSYQKRAMAVLDWLIAIYPQHQRRLMIRLVKGAYWDTEIKHSQLLGLGGYPVFTRKNATDVSFLACAKKLLAHPQIFFPQFATHNAYSVAAILEMAGSNKDFEFQCLHGMGRPLYDQLVGSNHLNIPCRIYAPVGGHKELLGYLVRRLLENGANTSFVNRIADEKAPIEKIIADPVLYIKNLASKPHPHIPLPRNIYGSERRNAQGMDLSNPHTIQHLTRVLAEAHQQQWQSGPIIDGNLHQHEQSRPVLSPSNLMQVVGSVSEATAADIEQALTSASNAYPHWDATPVATRASYLEHAADLFEAEMTHFIVLACREGGKNIPDCVAEVREAIDFCRYYALRARHDLTAQTLTGATGEHNELFMHGRGVFACISPWNFPLAIFIGQVVAALVAGNCVIAKPAEQTPLIAAQAILLLHRAGIPTHVLHLLPGQGETVGAKLVADPRIAGIIFTGSTETARAINQTLANRPGPIVPLIAETGGQNAMIVDSSALPEQTVQDIIQSAFGSAGQRCSALRVLFVQEDIADALLEMLKGAMAELSVGDPSLFATDVGPIIDRDALDMLQAHAERMRKEAKLIYRVSLPKLADGYYFAPQAFELENLAQLKREVFGPILHVLRYPAKALDKVMADITKTGYGLTMGVQSRIDSTVEYIASHMPVGNLYINRNMIGAVVGVQPFGGEGLSGTGPKAGGPHYLPRLCVERTISINTAAAGGNATLVSLKEDE